MTDKCMMRVETRKELAKIEEEYPMIVKAFLSDQCGHCASLKPNLEKECQETNAIMSFPVVPTVECPIDKDFCKKDMIGVLVEKFKEATGITGKLKKKQLKKIPIGVPTIFGQTSDGETRFIVQGDRPDEVNKHYSAIRALINNTKQKWVEKAGK